MKKRITDLKAGEKATVIGFENDGHDMERLMQMGLVEDTTVELIRVAPTGDPIEMLVEHYSLSLRRADARQIFVEHLPNQ